MDEFLRTSTSPSPNTYLSRLTPSVETGIKQPHIYHYCDVTFDEKHKEWRQAVQPLLKRLDINKTPSDELFQQRRRQYHPYIYSTPETDYSHCAKHFNFKQKHKVLASLFKHQYIHQCDATKCKRIAIFTSNKKNYKTQCNCQQCNHCQQLSNILNKKSTQLIKALCCKNKGKLPALKCERSSCDKCGYVWLLKCLKCSKHSFANYRITYDQIEVVDKSDEGNPTYGIQTHTVDHYSITIKPIICGVTFKNLQ